MHWYCVSPSIAGFCFLRRSVFGCVVTLLSHLGLMRWHFIPTCLDRHVSVPCLWFLYCCSQYCCSQAYSAWWVSLAETASPVPLVPIFRMNVFRCHRQTLDECGHASAHLGARGVILGACRRDHGADLCRSWRVVRAAKKKTFIWSSLSFLSSCQWLFLSAMFQLASYCGLSVLRSKLAVFWVPCHPWTCWPCSCSCCICTVSAAMNNIMMSFLANHSSPL